MEKFRHFASVLVFCVAVACSAQVPSIDVVKESVVRNHYTFEEGVTRPWIGSAFWSKPLENWRLSAGRVEVARRGHNLIIYNLLQQLSSKKASFETSVEIGRQKGEKSLGSAGFRVGAQSPLGDYRSPLIGNYGTNVGFAENGGLFVGKYADAQPNEKVKNAKSIRLKLKASPKGAAYEIMLRAEDMASGAEIAKLVKTLPAQRLVGNLGLVSSFDPHQRQKKNPNAAMQWFDNWKLSGDKITSNAKQGIGPIMWSQYTLSRQVMKMIVQMAPVDLKKNNKVRLQVKKANKWETIATEIIDPHSYSALFRIEKWDDKKDLDYRALYNNKAWYGQVRKDPVDRALSVAGFTGNADPLFPNTTLVGNVSKQNPDMLFFSGDQIYEPTGGYDIIRAAGPASWLNYLGKWYLFGWSFRDLLKDRPSVMLPDDHDVYQGNIWGNGGNATTMAEHQRGGYAQSADFVNVVHRTQTGHHPDAFDPTPMKQNISVYYGDMVYGRVSFAIIADRMFKSGPKGTVATWKGRPDHMNDKTVDVKSLDKPGLSLLGDRQLKFLNAWSQDWRGADIKCVLSQTIFCNLANYHGGRRQYVICDLDSNGWPQTGRRKALEEIRRGYGFMYAGDQHLASIVHHGIEKHRDSGFSFCVPSICVFYPRAWQPDREGQPIVNRIQGRKNTGDYKDGFGNLMTPYAVGNPEDKNRKGLEPMFHDKASGHGLVHFNTQDGSIKIECFKLMFDADNVKKEDQFPGWPTTINYQDNYGRQAEAWLPTLKFKKMNNPVVQVIDETNGEVVYTLRVKGKQFSPKVFKEGQYTLKVGGQGAGPEKIVKSLVASKTKDASSLEF